MVYLQTTPYTTAASSLLNLLEYKQVLKGDMEEEFKIWMSTAVLPVRASSIYGLAVYAKEKGLEPFLIVEKDEFDFPDYRFYRYKKQDVELAKITSGIYKKKAKEKNISCKVSEIKLNYIKELLEENYIILRVNVKEIRRLKRNSSNFLFFKDYKDGEFTAVDPVQGEIKIGEELVENGLKTLEEKKYRARKLMAVKK